MADMASRCPLISIMYNSTYTSTPNHHLWTEDSQQLIVHLEQIWALENPYEERTTPQQDESHDAIDKGVKEREDVTCAKASMTVGCWVTG